MKKIQVITVTHPENLFCDKKPLLDPWGDCQALTACLDPTEQEITVGISTKQKAVLDYENSSSVRGLLEVRVSSSTPDTWKSKQNGNRWKKNSNDVLDVLSDLLQQSVFAGGNIQHYQIWLARWAKANKASIKSLLSKKNNQTLVNLDLDPRQEKLAWAVQSAKENPKRRILLFGTRRLPNGIREFPYCAKSQSGTGIFFRSNRPFEIQPELL